MQRNPRLWPPRRGACLAAVLCTLSGFPVFAFAGMFDTALPTFSDGKAAQVVGLVPTVVNNKGIITDVFCTNLDTVPVNIGFEVFDPNGVLANSIAAGEGEFLGVAVGATVTIGTGGTPLLTEDRVIPTLPDLRNGSGRVVASEENVFCNALLVDEIHEIIDPDDVSPGDPFPLPPSLTRVPVWSCGNSVVDPFEQCDDGNKASGDGCESDCTLGVPPGCGNDVVNSPETCDPPGGPAGGNGNLCRFNCTVCGDAVVDFGEACDDGNGANGDGCENDCQSTTQQSQPQEPDQRKCINELNKNLAKVAKAQGKAICKCISDGSKGKLTGTIEACLTADNGGKVAKAENKTIAKAGQKCTTAPDFGATDASTVNSVGKQKELDLIHAIFGSDLDASVIDFSTDKDGSKCQVAVAKGAKKCQDAKLKSFNKCKKDALKGKSVLVETAGELRDQCLGTGSNGIPDPKGKITKACETKLLDTIGKKCSADLGAFPGCGTPATAQELRECVDVLVECQVCLALNQADNLSRDCDEFDDGLDNGSCP